MKQETNYLQDIPSGDALIHREITGPKEAQVMVLLHGNGEDLHIYDQQISYLSAFYRIVAIDTRGHGRSTRGTEPLDYYTFTSDLISVLDALCIEKATIVGFSDGAIIALHAAIKCPERIRSMVLIGANYNIKGIRLIPRLQIRLVYIFLSIAALFSNRACKRKEIWSLMVYHPNLKKEDIAQIAVPTMVITGEKDLVSQRQNDEIHSLIADSKRLVIPGGDHYWMFKKPVILSEIIRILERNDKVNKYLTLLMLWS